MYINLVPSVLIECNTTPQGCPLPSFRKDNTFLHAFVDLLINKQLKSSNKALLFIGRCDKSTEISSFAG